MEPFYEDVLGQKQKFFEDETGRRITYQEIEYDLNVAPYEDDAGDAVLKRGTAFSRRETVYDDSNKDLRATLDTRRGTLMDEKEQHPPSLNTTLTRGDRRRLEDERHLPSLNTTLQREDRVKLISTVKKRDPYDTPDTSLEDDVSSYLSKKHKQDEEDEEKARCMQCTSVRLFFKNTLLWTTTLHLLGL